MATRDNNDDDKLIIATKDRNKNDLAIDVKATHLASFFVCAEMLYRVFRCKGHKITECLRSRSMHCILW